MESSTFLNSPSCLKELLLDLSNRLLLQLVAQPISQVPFELSKTHQKGLFYYEWNQKLYIAVDDENTLFETDINGKNARSFKFQKGMNEEGTHQPVTTGSML